MPRPVVLLGVVLIAVWSFGCARDVIPNTDVEDTSDNREVLEFLETYRSALAERDVPALLRLAHPDYFDDNGTPSAHDDIDFDALQSKLELWTDRLEDVRYDIRYRHVLYAESGRVMVDYTYTGRFRVVGPDGESRWARRLDNNRIVLARHDESYRILSGM